MTAAELLAALDTLHLPALRLAALTGYSEGAVRNWTTGRARVPPDVAAWLKRRAKDWQRDPPPKRAHRAAPGAQQAPYLCDNCGRWHNSAAGVNGKIARKAMK